MENRSDLVSINIIRKIIIKIKKDLLTGNCFALIIHIYMIMIQFLNKICIGIIHKNRLEV